MAYPSETWTYEVLEKLPPGCSEETMLHAEQSHIERLRSWMKEHGFTFIRPSGSEICWGYWQAVPGMVCRVKLTKLHRPPNGL